MGVIVLRLDYARRVAEKNREIATLEDSLAMTVGGADVVGLRPAMWLDRSLRAVASGVMSK